MGVDFFWAFFGVPVILYGVVESGDARSGSPEKAYLFMKVS